MQNLAEKVLIGQWRSFKAFKRTGEVKLFNNKTFKEVEINNDRTLRIKTHKEQTVKQEAQTNKWGVVFKDKRFYLEVPDYSLAYEIITVNHTVLVLLDLYTKDKVFFAKDSHWESFLESNQLIVL